MKPRIFAILLTAGIVWSFSGCGGATEPASIQDNGTKAGGNPPNNLPSNLTPNEASAFLSRATFGTTPDAIDHLMKVGYEKWLEEQFEKPPTYHMRWMADHAEEVNNTGKLRDHPAEWRVHADAIGVMERDAWMEIAVHGEDQLRQRVAFALSEILVISRNGPLLTFPDARLSYYDVLLENAFGNFETLLKEVTFHPAMGRYLSYLGNAKADPTTGSHPDENYAREVMQLFTIGLYQLNEDGTKKLKNGHPIATYTQKDVREMARIFTGLTDDNGYFFPDEGGTSHRSRTTPMIAVETYHDTGEKVVLNHTFHAGNTTKKEIQEALHLLFTHPNTGPFIARQLIQRLVTSNPSPAYVKRVAEAFADNGKGVRGDLKAVIKAILLDQEALKGAKGVRSEPTFGKFREPLLYFTHLFRAFDAKNGIHTLKEGDTPLYRYRSFNFNGTGYTRQEGALEALTVFNYFTPEDAPYTLKKQNLVAPELTLYGKEGIDEVLMGLINKVDSIYDLFEISAELDLKKEKKLIESGDFDGLLSHLNTLLCAGNLSESSLKEIKNYLRSHKRLDAKKLARHAVGLVMTSPDYALQR